MNLGKAYMIANNQHSGHRLELVSSDLKAKSSERATTTQTQFTIIRFHTCLWFSDIINI
jgi:hypothetical protein